MEINLTDHKAVLFKNEYKEKDSQPDFVGKVSDKDTKEDIARISAWKNKSKNGVFYLSISFSELPVKRKEVEKEAVEDDPFDGGDDVPF